MFVGQNEPRNFSYQSTIHNKLSTPQITQTSDFLIRMRKNAK